MKDVLGSGGTQQPGARESSSGLVSKMFIACKTDILSSGNVETEHRGRAGGCFTYKLHGVSIALHSPGHWNTDRGVLIALHSPGHWNTDDSRLSSPFSSPSLLSF